ACHCIGSHCPVRSRKVVPEYSIDIQVKRCGRRHYPSHICGDRLTYIRVDPVDSVPVSWFHSLPEPECNSITRSRACLRRAALVGNFRETAEYLRVFTLVFVDYKVHAERTGNAMLRRALDGSDGLRPETVLPAIPEKPGLIGCTDKRH